jgi:molybdopterin synthase sulfur carrier subunit
MKIEIRFFARCREIVGEKQKELEVEEGMRIKDIIDILINEYPELRKEKLIASRNHKSVSLNTELNDKDVVAVFPPVSGG